MNDAVELFLILGALYGWDCASWIRRGALALQGGFPGRHRVAEPSAIAGNAERALVVASLWPSRSLHLLRAEPACFGAEGVSASELPSLARRAAPAPVPRFASWAACESATFRERQVLVEGRPFVELDSEALAECFAADLVVLAAAAPRERENLLNARLQARFDDERLSARQRLFQSSTRTLGWLANASFLAIYVALPGIAWRFGLIRTWPALLGAALVLCGATYIAADRAHRRLYPDRIGERRRRRLATLFAPLSLLRARDHLAREVLLDFDPLLVVSSALPRAAALPWIEHALRDLEHPLPRLVEPTPQVQAVESDQRRRYAKVLRGTLAPLGYACDALRVPELEAESVAYCPRCWGEYTRSDARCADCGELELTAAPIATRG